jgi:hypothetical protein
MLKPDKHDTKTNRLSTDWTTELCHQNPEAEKTKDGNNRHATSKTNLPYRDTGRRRPMRLFLLEEEDS